MYLFFGFLTEYCKYLSFTVPFFNVCDSKQEFSLNSNIALIVLFDDTVLNCRIIQNLCSSNEKTWFTVRRQFHSIPLEITFY